VFGLDCGRFWPQPLGLPGSGAAALVLPPLIRMWLAFRKPTFVTGLMRFVTIRRRTIRPGGLVPLTDDQSVSADDLIQLRKLLGSVESDDLKRLGWTIDWAGDYLSD